MASHGSVTRFPICVKPSVKSEELDPEIWSNFPYDLILRTIEFLSGQDLINWSCVNWTYSSFASSRLWRQVSISYNDITSYGAACEHPKSIYLLLYGDSGKNIVQHLVHDALTFKPTMIVTFSGLQTVFVESPRINYPVSVCQIRATFKPSTRSPSSRIRELVIVRKRRERGTPHIAAFLNIALPRLLNSLPNLVKVVYGAGLGANILCHLHKVQGLESLDFRFSVEKLNSSSKCSSDDLDPVDESNTARRSWNSMLERRINFDLFNYLANLKTLRIGCLNVSEAKGLASCINCLDVENLQLSCHRYNRNWATDVTISPLALFLFYLVDQNVSTFPRSLKTLMLADRDHYKIPLLHQHIANAIAPCSALRMLGITNIVDKDRLRSMGGHYIYASNKQLAVQSWQQLDCDEDIELHFQYSSYTGEVLSTRVLPEPLDPPTSNISKTLDNIARYNDTSRPLAATIVYVKDASLPNGTMMVIPCTCDHTSSVEQLTSCSCTKCEAKRAWNDDLGELTGSFRDLETEYRINGNNPHYLASETEGKGLWAKQMDAALEKAHVSRLVHEQVS